MTFFTDGVAEAESPGRVRFGVARALQVIRSEREKPAREIIEGLHQEVLGFCRSQPPRDDITMVVVKVTEDWSSRPVVAKTGRTLLVAGRRRPLYYG